MLGVLLFVFAFILTNAVTKKMNENTIGTTTAYAHRWVRVFVVMVFLVAFGFKLLGLI